MERDSFGSWLVLWTAMVLLMVLASLIPPRRDRSPVKSKLSTVFCRGVNAAGRPEPAPCSQLNCVDGTTMKPAACAAPCPIGHICGEVAETLR